MEREHVSTLFYRVLTSPCRICDPDLGRLLVDAAVGVVGGLSAKGGRWAGGNLQTQPARAISPGMRISYWLHAVPLLPEPPPASSEMAGRGEAGEPSSSVAFVAAGGGTRQGGGGGVLGIRYHLEVGSDASAATVVRHLPQLPPLEIRPGDDLAASSTSPFSTSKVGGPGGLPSGPLPSEQQQQQKQGGVAAAKGGQVQRAAVSTVIAPPELRLDSAYVNVDELLLRSAAHVATAELLALRSAVEAALAGVVGASAAVAAEQCTVRLALRPVPWTLRQVAAAARDAAAAEAAESAATPPSSSGGRRQRGSCGGSGAGLSGGGHIVLHCPELEFSVGGSPLFRISKSLFTGRILFRPDIGDSESLLIDDIQTALQVGPAGVIGVRG